MTDTYMYIRDMSHNITHMSIYTFACMFSDAAFNICSAARYVQEQDYIDRSEVTEVKPPESLEVTVQWGRGG